MPSPFFFNLRQKDTPGNTPLLYRNKTTSDLFGCYFRLIDRHHSRCHTDRETVQDTADTKHGRPIRCRLEKGADDEQSRGADQGVFTTETVGGVSGKESAYKAACRERAVDATLQEGIRIMEIIPISAAGYQPSFSFTLPTYCIVPITPEFEPMSKPNMMPARAANPPINCFTVRSIILKRRVNLHRHYWIFC